jgi:hypothetical protein
MAAAVVVAVVTVAAIVAAVAAAAVTKIEFHKGGVLLRGAALFLVIF